MRILKNSVLVFVIMFLLESCHGFATEEIRNKGDLQRIGASNEGELNPPSAWFKSYDNCFVLFKVNNEGNVVEKTIYFDPGSSTYIDIILNDSSLLLLKDLDRNYLFHRNTSILYELGTIGTQIFMKEYPIKESFSDKIYANPILSDSLKKLEK